MGFYSLVSAERDKRLSIAFAIVLAVLGVAMCVVLFSYYVTKTFTGIYMDVVAALCTMWVCMVVCYWRYKVHSDRLVRYLHVLEERHIIRVRLLVLHQARMGTMDLKAYPGFKEAVIKKTEK